MEDVYKLKAAIIIIYHLMEEVEKKNKSARVAVPSFFLTEFSTVRSSLQLS